jgi:pimeloyl-ACP methyl ester carboxylesterase
MDDNVTRRRFMDTTLAAGLTLQFAQEGLAMSETAPPLKQRGYAPVNGLEMYYEVHGEDRGRVPLLLLHGSLGSLEMFRPLLPALTKSRQVLAVDQQGHGRTADVERPLHYEQLGDDAAAFLRWLGVARTDVFGFSMGSAAGWQLAIRHPELVRKLVGAISYKKDGIYAQVLAGLNTTFSPDAFAGTPIEAEYRTIAPHPDAFPTLVLKVQDLTRSAADWSVEMIQAIAAPTLIIIGDADIITPEHAVALFRLRGGGVPGDFVSMPPAQLAILPGTSHLMLIERTEWLGSMLAAFLDAPSPAAQ